MRRIVMIVWLAVAALACLEDVDDGHPAPDRDVAPDGGTFDPDSVRRGGGGSGYGGSGVQGSGVQGSGVQGSGAGAQTQDAAGTADGGATPDAGADAGVDGALG